jgi:hypothetical protein
LLQKRSLPITTQLLVNQLLELVIALDLLEVSVPPPITQPDVTPFKLSYETSVTEPFSDSTPEQSIPSK